MDKSPDFFRCKWLEMVHHSSLVPFPCLLILRCTHYFVSFHRETLFIACFCGHGLDLRNISEWENIIIVQLGAWSAFCIECTWYCIWLMFWLVFCDHMAGIYWVENRHGQWWVYWMSTGTKKGLNVVPYDSEHFWACNGTSLCLIDRRTGCASYAWSAVVLGMSARVANAAAAALSWCVDVERGGRGGGATIASSTDRQ